MKMVRFKDGSYGIRKGLFKPFYRYLDFDCNTRDHYSRWRNKKYDLFDLNCTMDLESVHKVYSMLNDYGVIQKELSSLNSGE